MIIEPPGEPSATNGLPSRRTIVGLIELRGLPTLDAVRVRRRVEVEVGELVAEQEPNPGTTRPEPPVDSIVKVYETTLPHLSLVVRWVVVSTEVVSDALPALNGRGSPGATGDVAAVPGDQRASCPRVLLRQETGERHVVVRWIGEARVAIGERVPRCPPGSSAERLHGALRRGRSPRGCSAPRRRSSRRSTAVPSSRCRCRDTSRVSVRLRRDIRADRAWSSRPSPHVVRGRAIRGLRTVSTSASATAP